MNRFVLVALMTFLVGVIYSQNPKEFYDESFQLKSTLSYDTSYHYTAGNNIIMIDSFLYSPRMGNFGKFEIGEDSPQPIISPNYGYESDPGCGGAFSTGGVVGTIPYEFSVSETGAAVITVPLELPSGPNGIKPDLAFVYNSQGGDGIMGVRWSLGGMSKISRTPYTFEFNDYSAAVDFSEDDQYALDGMMLVKEDRGNGVNYYPEVIDGSYITIYSSNGGQGFIKHAANGWLYYYGTTKNSRYYLIDPKKYPQYDILPIEWHLTKVVDPYGNCIEYTYINDIEEGSFLPNTIDYGKKTGGRYPYSVKFTYRFYDDPEDTIARSPWGDWNRRRPDTQRKYFSYKENNNRIGCYSRVTQALSMVSIVSNDIEIPLSQPDPSHPNDSIGIFDFSNRSYSLCYDYGGDLKKFQLMLISEGICTHDEEQIDVGIRALPLNSRNPLCFSWKNDSLVWIRRNPLTSGCDSLLSMGIINNDYSWKQLAVFYPHLHSKYTNDVIGVLEDEISGRYQVGAFKNVSANSQNGIIFSFNDEYNTDAINDFLAGHNRKVKMFNICDTDGDGVDEFLVIYDANNGSPLQIMLYKLDNQNVFVGTPLNATIPWSADNITVGDFNGDNLSDIMYVLDGDVVFLLTRPDSDIVPFGYPILQTNLNVGETKVLLMGDFDGDKHQAVMMITEDFVKVFKLVAHKDNGVVNYSVENVTYLCNPFSEFVIPSILPNPSVRFLAGDYNGDAKTDILVLDDSNSSGEDNWCFYFSMGNGLFEEVIRAKNDKIAGYNLFVNDLNDDGCSDVCCIIRGSDGSNSQYGNTSHYYWYRRDYHIQPVHNHVDIYKREPLDTYKTLEWDENQQDSVWITHSVPIPFDVQLRDVPYSFEDDWNVGFGNFTGGSSSQVLFCRPLAKGGQMYIKPVATCYPEGKVRHVIDTIIDGFGARRVINYTTVACQVLQRDELEKGSDRNSFNPVRLYYGNLAVVNNMCFEAEQNDFSSANTDYYFINPRFDTHGRGMIGFDRSVTIERFKTTRKEFTYNNVYHFMVPLRVENITDDGDRVVENYEYGFMQLKKHFPLKCFKPFLARVEKQYVHDEITYKTEIETISKSDIDNYGNVLKTKREYGGNGGHVVSYKKYLNKLNVGDRRFLGLVTSDSTVYALVPGETPVVKCVNYEYDKVTCRMIKKVFEKDSPNRLDETYTYDNFGNMLSKKAISEGVVKSESMTYCPKGIFMLSKTDALGHVTSFTYHKIRCLLAADTDPNGLTTIYHYNTIGELDKVTRSDGTQQMMAKRWLFGDYLQHPYNPDKQRVAYYSWSQETNGPMRYAFYDHHQNKLRDVVINNEGDYIDDDMTFVDYEYDYSSEKRIREGFVFKKSVPYLSTLLSFEMDHVRDTFNPPPIMPELRHWYQYKYDSSDRLVLISRDDGYSDEQHWYGGLSAHTRSFDGQNKQVHYLTNGLVDSVIDNNGCYLKYRYYADGSVKSVTINGDPTTTVSYTYDNYGNLATMIDPSLDTVVYQYDAFGNLLHYTDSKGTTDYEYDLLGRMTHRSNAELDTRWEWDPENAIGQLSCARQENRYGAIQAVVDEYKYDELGRLKEQAQTIKGEKLSFKYAYNANGKLKSTTYPSGLKITNTYDGCGSLVKIRRNGKPLWEAKKINAYGTLNEFVANGEIVVRKTFDTITGDVTSIEALTNSLNSFFLQNYSWDEQCGNMASRIDKIANLADHFGYDAFNRLESIATRKNSALLSQTNLTYNPYGNIIAKDGVGSYDYAGDDNPYSINTLSDVETLGNFAEEQRAIYTTFNKLSELTQNDKHLQIAYGPDDQRVWQEFTTPKESKQKRYFTQLYETVTENGVTKNLHYLYAPSGLFAIFATDNNANETMHYTITDHQGSLAACIDATQDVTCLGRMLSPDIVVQQADNTQSYNRYSYCLNNPLRFVDPTGWVTTIPPEFARYYNGGLLLDPVNYKIWLEGNSAKGVEYSTTVSEGNTVISYTWYDEESRQYGMTVVDHGLGHGEQMCENSCAAFAVAAQEARLHGNPELTEEYFMGITENACDNGLFYDQVLQELVDESSVYGVQYYGNKFPSLPNPTNSDFESRAFGIMILNRGVSFRFYDNPIEKNSTFGHVMNVSNAVEFRINNSVIGHELNLWDSVRGSGGYRSFLYFAEKFTYKIGILEVK